MHLAVYPLLPIFTSPKKIFPLSSIEIGDPPEFQSRRVFLGRFFPRETHGTLSRGDTLSRRVDWIFESFRFANRAGFELFSGGVGERWNCPSALGPWSGYLNPRGKEKGKEGGSGGGII